MDPRLYRAAVDGFIPLLQEVTGKLPSESEPELLLHLTPQGNNVLHIAVRSGHKRFISYVMGKCPSALAQPNSNGETPLHIAAKEGSIKMLKFLLHCLNISWNSADATEELLTMKEKFHDEGRRGLLCAVPYVLDIPPLSLYTGPAGRTALHKAIIANTSDEICEWAKTFPEMIKKKDGYGWSPLHYASHFGFSASTHILLAIDTSCAYETNMHGMYGHLLAAHKGHDSVIWEFYKHCPDCFELFDSQGRSALHVAAEAGKLEVFRFLTEKTHHHINLPDNRGCTPLLLASKSQNELLLASLRDHLKVRDSKVLLPQLEVLNVNHEMPIPSEIQVSPETEDWERAMEKGVPPEIEGSKETMTEDVASQLLQSASEETEARETRKNDVSRRLKDKASTHLLVATLIATVSFAAGINMPGGYREDASHQGTATLTEKTAFQAFVVSNSLAFCVSATSIAIHFIMIIERRVINRAVLLLFALFLTFVGLIGMVVAFISATIAVLTSCVPLWVAFSVFGFFLFSIFSFFMVLYVIIGLPSRKKVSVDTNRIQTTAENGQGTTSVNIDELHGWKDEYQFLYKISGALIGASS